MKAVAKSLIAASLLALTAPSAHAFMDGMIAGMTSVTNNLIDSTENVTVTSINTTSTTVLLLSNDIGKMADRINVMADKIGVMADRIGVMADRIVVTESMMAGFAHKVADNNHELAVLRLGGQVAANRSSVNAPAAPLYTPPGQAYRVNAYLPAPAFPAPQTVSPQAASAKQCNANPWQRQYGVC